MKRMTVISAILMATSALVACRAAGPARPKPATDIASPDPVAAAAAKPIPIDTDRKRLIVARRAIDELIILDRILNSRQITIAGISHTLPDQLLTQLRQRLDELRNDCIVLMDAVGRDKG